jgi:hypothetical protein
MAAAGAAAAARTGQPAYTIKRLGLQHAPKGPASIRRAPKRPAVVQRAPKRPAGRYAAAAVGTVVALLAVGGVALLSWTHIARHTGPAVAAPGPARSKGGWPNAVTWSPVPRVSARGVPSASPTVPRSSARGVPGGSRLTQWQEVTGIGCPQDDNAGVSLSSAPTGPGWTMASGGWTGNGCDGSAVWTMNPNGNQPVPSALTWTFQPVAGLSRCTLAVFVPTQNSLGVGNYAIFTGSPAAPQNIATVSVSQSAAGGQWITLGSYPVSGTSVEIQVAPATSAPGEPGPGAHGRNHIVGQSPGHNAAVAASAASAQCS